jgi:signal transduction histidine kinase
MTKPWNKHDLVSTVREALRSFDQDLKLEEQNTVLTHLNHLLEQKVDERTAALQAANLQLQQLNQELTRSNEALEQFTAMVSHDLRQPLQSIVGFAKLLKLQFGSRLESPALAYVNKIIAAGDRLHQMLNDLLTYAQVGMENHTATPVNCTQVLNEVIANLQWAIDESQAEIHIDPLPTLMGNASQLLQLFQNLISNAIKFARVGVPLQVRIWVQQVDQGWQFCIQDNGTGIPAQECDRIFRLFHRVSPDNNPVQGSGIGLATCQKIVERHGGKIWVESCLGSGTTLFFTIPCTPNDP